MTLENRMFSNNVPYNKEHKIELEKSAKIACGFCRYHRGENSGREGRAGDRGVR